ncbi:hypothetical protein [Streptococcus mitis]|uniref:hypothetical protein n=1 Tax=Streptococcus mitis TaxID=28037 RepID=UPI0012492244|nr:hypothetical protein [Streptococcus mitis]
MRRHRLIITKLIYPILFVINVYLGVQFYLYFTSSPDKFINYVSPIYLIVFSAFVFFLVISFFVLMKTPTMKKYEKSLKTVLEYENRDEDVIQSEGQKISKETDYRLSAKRVYCPTCDAPTEGVVGSSLTCENCGETFEVS